MPDEKIIEKIESLLPSLDVEKGKKAKKEFDRQPERQKIQDEGKIAVAEVVYEEARKGLISFDSYFAIHRKKNPKIQEHHKAPIRAFCATKLGDGLHTRAEFEETISKY